MIEYIKYLCPHCGQPIRLHEYKSAYKYGSPLKSCQNCKKQYIDRYYRELAIGGVSENDEIKVSPKYALLILAGIVFLAASYIKILKKAGDNWILIIMGIMCILVGVTALIYSISCRKKWKKTLEEETKASETRLADTNYAYLLKNAGYEVPEQYLRKTPDTNTGKKIPIAEEHTYSIKE